MKLTDKNGLNPRIQFYAGLLLGVASVILGVLRLAFPGDQLGYKLSWFLPFLIAGIWFYMAWQGYRKSKQF